MYIPSDHMTKAEWTEQCQMRHDQAKQKWTLHQQKSDRKFNRGLLVLNIISILGALKIWYDIFFNV